MVVVAMHFLVVVVYLLGMLLTNYMFIDYAQIASFEQTESVLYITAVMGLIVLLEHYAAVSMAKKNGVLWKHLNAVLLFCDIALCAGCAAYMISHFGAQLSVSGESVVIISFYLVQLSCRVFSFFNLRALKITVPYLWDVIIGIHHLCAVLYVEALCITIAVLIENPMSFGWVMLGLVIAILLIAEHYSVLHCANNDLMCLVSNTEKGKKVIDIIYAALDGIIVLSMLVLAGVLAFQFEGVSIGAILYIIVMQLLILLPRIKWLRIQYWE